MRRPSGVMWRARTVHNNGDHRTSKGRVLVATERERLSDHDVIKRVRSPNIDVQRQHLGKYRAGGKNSDDEVSIMLLKEIEIGFVLQERLEVIPEECIDVEIPASTIPLRQCARDIL